MSAIRFILSLFITAPVTSQAVELALVQPRAELIDRSLTPAEAHDRSRAALLYYTFWHTGDARYAQAALADDFIDLNLPAGRPQGPTGPVMAARQFREAIPDLSATVEEMLVVGDRVIGRLRFRGHFTGHFKGVTGKGQAIDFSAVDIYRIENGKVRENWHLEDNLTLLKQMGIVAR